LACRLRLLTHLPNAALFRYLGIAVVCETPLDDLLHAGHLEEEVFLVFLLIVMTGLLFIQVELYDLVGLYGLGALIPLSFSHCD
jgi:hypothetical protein